MPSAKNSGTTSSPKKQRPESASVPFQNPSLSINERVEDLLSRMTVYEKIGQMTQLDITLVNNTGKQDDVSIDAPKARKLIREHHIGSFLNGEAVTPETWFSFTNQLSKIGIEEHRLGIPLIFGIDHIHGATYVTGATYFPQSINLGATFNPEHAFQTGRITALESADLGHHWIFSPVLDIAANPLWPRFYETYGEDPYLCGLMGTAHVKGIQENDETSPAKQAACSKHFLGYSDPHSGRDRTPARLPMQQIHEFHRPSFQKAIDNGLKTVMLNSGEINGVPVHASYEILTTLLRDQMGFEGVVVTDWDDVGKLEDFHFTAENYKEAVYDSVMAGIDVCMTPLHLKFNTCLKELVEEGRITEERLDFSVRRILRLKFELGLFENPHPRNDRFDRIGNAGNKAKALDAARESIVLLKNEHNVLPLEKPAKIGVFGPSASSRRNLCGGWTIKWQGGKEDQYPDIMHTLFSALKKEFPGAHVKHFTQEETQLIAASDEDRQKEFISALDSYDLLVYAGGEEPYTEFVGNITDLRLPHQQTDEILFLSRSKAPLSLVLIEGRPRLITEASEAADAIIFAGLPGVEGAEAIANIISGRVNPSGKLPFSYPKNPNHFLPYNHKKSQLYYFDPEQANYIMQNDESPSLFQFGDGLSYTRFVYSNLKLSASELKLDGQVSASVTITNEGKREGMESVLWFTSCHFGKITRPVKELKKAEKITLKPGESQTLHFEISPELLSYPNDNGEAVLERTGYTVRVGGLSGEFRIPKG
ncbi:MAG: glycoside hydrolase family 3 C-terminal domain-containing protein [Balneolia bacterium]|nr:glycoside hydrolase family 3 C-terminal domain-containing protein [Balneolia bacterium]